MPFEKPNITKAIGIYRDSKTLLVRACLLQLQLNSPDMHAEVIKSIGQEDWRLFFREEKDPAAFVFLMKDPHGLEVPLLRFGEAELSEGSENIGQQETQGPEDGATSQGRLDKLVKAFCNAGSLLYGLGLENLQASNPELYENAVRDIDSGHFRPCITAEINPPEVVASVRDEQGRYQEVFRYKETLIPVH